MTKEKAGAMPAFFVVVAAEPFVVSLSNHERSSRCLRRSSFDRLRTNGCSALWKWLSAFAGMTEEKGRCNAGLFRLIVTAGAVRGELVEP
jgi:hypothetical protein